MTEIFLREGGNEMDSIDEHSSNEPFPIDSSSELVAISTLLRSIYL